MLTLKSGPYVAKASHFEGSRTTKPTEAVWYLLVTRVGEEPLGLVFGQWSDSLQGILNMNVQVLVAEFLMSH